MFLIDVDEFQWQFGHFINCSLYSPENTDFQPDANYLYIM